MALITCPECTREISDTAPACPHCGYRRTATTIEETAKRWKALQLVGTLTVVLGILVLIMMSDSNNPAVRVGPVFLIVGGVVLYLYGRLQAWWHHG